MIPDPVVLSGGFIASGKVSTGPLQETPRALVYPARGVFFFGHLPGTSCGWHFLSASSGRRGGLRRKGQPGFPMGYHHLGTSGQFPPQNGRFTMKSYNSCGQEDAYASFDMVFTR